MSELRTHQTIRLGRGRHASPDDGACVMELASMLAGEPFSDRPRAVCPVIGSFLRTYNDRIDDGRRQDLYAVASLAVGTRAPRCVERERGRACVRAAREVTGRRLGWLGVMPRRQAARYAAAMLSSGSHPQGHATALGLVGDLARIGRAEDDAVGGMPGAVADLELH